MNVYAISDLHLSFDTDKPMDIFGASWENYTEIIKENWSQIVKEDDIVLLAGDLSWAMTLQDALNDIKYIAALKGKKVIIKGNHDYWWGSISRLREALPQNVYALQNDSIKIGDYVICGTRGWTCPEGDNLSEQDQKIYNREALRLEMSLKNMSKIRNEGDTAISLMHFPPFNSRREQSLFTQLFQKYNIDSVVYGHIHGSVSRADKYIEKCGIKYYLTSCDMLSNIPVKIY